MKSEEFWKGNFGEEYTNRNQEILQNQICFFSKINKKINTVLELGANTGINLDALKLLYPDIEATGVEINSNACSQIYPEFEAINSSIKDYISTETRKFDLVFTKGVLIHIPPDELTEIYKAMGRLSSKYVLIAEYYSPKPVEIDYRGNKNKLWKRDFAKEFLQECPKFELDNYGFVYHLDNRPQDDLTWFLFKYDKK